MFRRWPDRRWDPVARVLQIADRELCVSAEVTDVELMPGLAVIAHGHRDQRSQRWIMTAWTRDPTAPHAFRGRD